MSYAAQVLEAERILLTRKAALERLSAVNQPDTARGRKARERYTAEAERLDALRLDVERALAVLRTTETETEAFEVKLRDRALAALVEAALDLGVIDRVYSSPPDPTCDCVGCVRRRT